MQHGLEPEETIAEAIARMRSGKSTASEIVANAIDSARRCQETLSALAVVSDGQARASALESDRRYAGGEARILEGVPIVVKDLIDTENISTRYGSIAYMNHVPKHDAEVVRILRANGAVVVGKATTHEFAWGVTTASVNFGDTLNPCDLSRIPGGSSGGTAAAVAFGTVPIGLGTDTGGSVRIPAALCGVVGFKPSIGTISTDGVFPLAPSLDHVGILGRSVDDVSRAAAALNIQVSDSEVGAGIRVGAIDHLETVPLEPVVEKAFRQACSVLADHFECSRVTDITAFTGAFQSFAGIVLAEGGVTHFSRHDMDTIERLYEAETVARLRLSASVVLGDYGRHQKRRREIKSSVSDLMMEYDFLVLPTCPCVAPKVGTEELSIGPWSGTVRQALMSNTSAFNLTGMPSISVPWPVEDGGLPIGIQLVGTLGDDARLLNFAYEVEAIFQRHTSKAGIHK